MEKKKESIVLALIALIIGILALILSWVPIVNNFAAILAVIGFLLAVIALIINRKNKKTLSIVGLVISIVAFIIVLATQAFYAKTLNDSFKSSENSSKVEKTSGKASVSESKESKKTKKSDSNLLIDSQYKEIADQNGADTAVLVADKSYSVTWSDNSWAGLNISVDKVDIIKVSGYKDYSDDEYQGFAVVHYNIDNSQQDVTAYPEQADVSTNTGLQTSGNYEMEHFAGDLMKGTKTSGYAAYPLKELNDVNDIKSLRINFSASYETDNYDDDNSNHTYDFTLNLN